MVNHLRSLIILTLLQSACGNDLNDGHSASGGPFIGESDQSSGGPKKNSEEEAPLPPNDDSSEEDDALNYAPSFQTLAPMNPRSDAPAGTKLRDIITHLPASYGNTYYDADQITWGHETSHGIHSYLRNKNPGSGAKNGFYVLQNRYLILAEPNLRKSDANAYVPASLRGSRYDLYMRGSTSWDDTPLYIWDEWNSYVNGSDVGVEYVQKGLWKLGWRDGVAGSMEFNAYAIALAMAVVAKDPSYTERNRDFLTFLAFNLQRSMAAFQIGRELSEFAWDKQEKLFDNFLNSSDARNMRRFLTETYSVAWCIKHFGEGDWE